MEISESLLRDAVDPGDRRQQAEAPEPGRAEERDFGPAGGCHGNRGEEEVAAVSRDSPRESQDGASIGNALPFPLPCLPSVPMAPRWRSTAFPGKFLMAPPSLHCNRQSWVRERRLYRVPVCLGVSGGVVPESMGTAAQETGSPLIPRGKSARTGPPLLPRPGRRSQSGRSLRIRGRPRQNARGRKAVLITCSFSTGRCLVLHGSRYLLRLQRTRESRRSPQTAPPLRGRPRASGHRPGTPKTRVQPGQQPVSSMPGPRKMRLSIPMVYL